MSEFEGEQGRSGLPKYKCPGLMRASEKLRLIYTTGTIDPDAPRDRAAWLGDAPTETSDE